MHLVRQDARDGNQETGAAGEKLDGGGVRALLQSRRLRVWIGFRLSSYVQCPSRGSRDV